MDKKTTDPELGRRVERAIGPIAAGMILDVADFATFGRIGLLCGAFVGGFVGWYLSGFLKVPREWRFCAISAAALYCVVPGTEFLPLATILGALSRFFERPPVPRTEDVAGKKYTDIDIEAENGSEDRMTK